MIRTYIALAAGLCLAAATVSASAGGLSFESRGYGGPLYVGPNFQQGGQYSPPSYGPKSSSQERSTTKRERSITRSHKTPATREADTENASAAGEGSSIATTVETENSTISGASLQTDNLDTKANAEPSPKAEAAAASPTTCKMFIAAAGKTVTVPCD